MLVRKATPKDAKYLAQIDKQAQKEIKGWHPRSSKEFHKIVKGVFVAVQEKNIVGYANVRKEAGKLWLEDIYVVKGLRKNGIAKRLLKKIKGTRDVHIVLLAADRNKKIFERLGFKKTMNYMELE
jgi:N-acetylglutamate synthase-like GNAT family acetyltransferase